MSMTRYDHIVYGWKLPNPLMDNGIEIDIYDEKFDSYREGHPGEQYCIYTDEYVGFIVFGQRILDSDDYGWNFENLDILRIPSEFVKNKYKELFEIKEDISEPTLFIFTEYV